MGTTLPYGIVVGVPPRTLAGPVFAMSLRRIQATPAAIFRNGSQVDDARLPGAFNSFATALLPVLLLGATTLLSMARPDLNGALSFFSNPLVVMLLSYLVAVFTLGLAQRRSLAQ